MRSDSALRSFFPGGVCHTNLREGLNELRTQDGLPTTGNRLLRGLCSSNILILVGEKDATQGPFRKRFGDYDLTQTQGNGRKQRAVNWIASMKASAKANGCPFNMAFSVVAKAPHSMNNRFLDYAKDYLCDDMDLILAK